MNRLATYFREIWRRLTRRAPAADSPPSEADQVRAAEAGSAPAAYADTSPARGALAPDTDPPSSEPEPESIGADDEGEDDDEENSEDDETDEEDDPLAPDPFVSPERPTQTPLTIEALAQKRAEAQAMALCGEHKIYLSDMAGPGTLAEALNQLLQEGKVTATFQDLEGEEPHLLYRLL